MLYVQKRKHQKSGVAPNKSKILASIKLWQETFSRVQDPRSQITAKRTIAKLKAQL